MAKRHSKRANKTTTGPAAKPGAAKKRKQPMKAPTVAERRLQDARRIYAATVAHYAAIQAQDAGRKQKLLPKARLDSYGLLIRQTSTAMTAHQLQKTTSKGATSKEAKLRKALVAKVVELRDVMATVYAADQELTVAFGRTKRLSHSSNRDALSLAAEQEQSFAHPLYGPKARAAGITPKQIASLVSARRALAAAETTQSSVQADKKGQGQDKASLLKALDAEKVHAKKVAGIVFRGQSKVLLQFGHAPKRRVTKRKAKVAAAPVVAPPVVAQTTIATTPLATTPKA